MEVNVLDGQSYLQALDGEPEIYGSLLDANGRAYAEYTFLRISDSPIYAELIDPATFNFEWRWCHIYRLGKRMYDTDKWEYADLKYIIDEKEEEKRNLDAYNRAMKIL